MLGSLIISFYYEKIIMKRAARFRAAPVHCGAFRK